MEDASLSASRGPNILAVDCIPLPLSMEYYDNLKKNRLWGHVPKHAAAGTPANHMESLGQVIYSSSLYNIL